MLLAPSSPHLTPSSPDGKGWYYQQPNTGVTFRAHALDVLISQIEAHRFALAGREGIEMDLAYGWQNRLKHDLCILNPNAPSWPNPEAEGFEPPHVAQGRALWAELHQKASETTDPYQLRDWFDRWLNRVPNYVGCRCRENAVHLLHEMPPDFSPEGFKDWAIRFHNGINRKLGKKQWPYPTEPESSTLVTG